jgi:hypothetical protein
MELCERDLWVDLINESLPRASHEFIYFSNFVRYVKGLLGDTHAHRLAIQAERVGEGCRV